MRTVYSYAVLALGILLAVWRLQTPVPVSSQAPATSFSAERAFADIRVIAQHPHPVGSPEHDVVRDYLAARLKQMGFDPQIHRDQAVMNFGTETRLAPVSNIIARLPGKDPRKPAVMVMSHYDSETNSPGAADDSTGVAASLEIARALRAGPQLDRDVFFVITDGEELGLLGATAFFKNDPLARRAGAVINFEARGDSGLVAMFETGPLNSDTVAKYASGAVRPSANSLSRVIYKNMPNGTDFTLAVERGLPGLNFAFIGDESAYHTPLATPAHLDRGSVQHMGDQALPAVRAFAAGLPQQKADSVYSDVFGFFIIQYSFAVGWIVFAFAAGLALYAVWAAARKTSTSWLRGGAGVLLLLLVPALLLWTAAHFFDGLYHFQRLPHFSWLLIGAGAIAIGAAAFTISSIEQGRGRLAFFIGAPAAGLLSCLHGFDLVALGLALAVALLAWVGIQKERRPAALWHCVLLVLVLLTGVTQAFVPEAAFMLAWPFLVAALVAAVRVSLEDGHWAGGLLALLAAVLVAAFTATSAIFLFTAIGVDMPVTLVLPLLCTVAIFLLLPGAHRVPLSTHGLIVFAGFACFAYARFAPPTPDRPAPAIVQHVQDLDSGKAFRVTEFKKLDPWTETALGKARYDTLPWSGEQKSWWAPAKPANVPPSSLTIRRDGARLLISAKNSPGAYVVILESYATESLQHSTLDGAALAAPAPGQWNQIRVYAPDPNGMVWAVDAPKTSELKLRLRTVYFAWPKDAAPLPAMPANQMAFGLSGMTQTVQQRSWKP